MGGAVEMTLDEMAAKLDEDQISWLVIFMGVNAVLFLVALGATVWLTALTFAAQWVMLRWMEALIQIAADYKEPLK